MSFEVAAQIADSVLYEGYLLYPYRASAGKNRVRWQFGIVAPREYSEATESDPWFLQTEFLLEVDREDNRAAIDVRLRCLQLQSRTASTSTACEPLVWDEGVERTIDADDVRPDALLECDRERSLPIHLAAGRDAEDGLERTRLPIDGWLRIGAARLGRFVKVRIRVENVTADTADLADRDRAMRRSMVGTHVMVAARGAQFVSLLDPPAEAAAAAASCVNLHAWPVLVGSSERRDTLLAAPIILYDYPAIAPESRGDLFDGTEIDEILSLRVLTLTDDEKQAARATDARAAAIVDRVEAMTGAEMSTLHGAWRELLNPADAPAPENASIDVAGVRISRGSRVRLDPRRRADPIDILVRGRVARVQGVYRDLDDRVHVAVVLDDDPAGDLHASYGRFMYYGPEELVPLEDA
jgi:hypothetical protein